MSSPRIISEEISKIDIRLNPRQYSFEVLRVICRNLGYHFGSILLVDEKGKGSIFSAYNLPETYPQMVNRVSAPVLSSPSGIAIREKKVIVVNDVFSDSRLEPWYDLLRQLDIKTIVWVPLLSKGKAFGTYNLYDQRKREIAEQEIDILNQLSILFSMAIRSSEYIDEIRQKTEELEDEIIMRKQVEKELRIAKEQAEAANLAKSEFLANISHEIRTPMNAIIGFTRMLQEKESNPDKMETFEFIYQAGETLLALIDDILDVAQMEFGKMGLENIDFSLNDIMNQIYDMFTRKAEEKKLEFSVTTDPSVPSIVCGDPYRISQVLLHIVRNAFKFTNQGRISVECTYDDNINMTSFKIADTGIGIPGEKLKLIFSAFSQVETSTTRKYEGLGLGLTIAAKLVDKMGGEISVESEKGAGAIFTVHLPLLPYR